VGRVPAILSIPQRRQQEKGTQQNKKANKRKPQQIRHSTGASTKIVNGESMENGATRHACAGHKYDTHEKDSNIPAPRQNRRMARSARLTKLKSRTFPQNKPIIYLLLCVGGYKFENRLRYFFDILILTTAPKSSDGLAGPANPTDRN
jgi:hypothetical protein